ASLGTAAKPALETIPGESVSSETVAAPTSTSKPTDEVSRIKSALEARRKMFLVTVLDAARAISLQQNELCIEFLPEARHFRDTLARADNVKILREVCQEMTGGEIGVRISIQDQEADSAPVSKEEEERREKQLLKESAEKNPLVQQMLRTFRGEIVDVRRVEPEQ